jgi:hypothetical protein
MRSVFSAVLAAAGIAFGPVSVSAAPSRIAAMPNAAPLTQPVQDNYHGGYTYGWGWGYGYNFIPACPSGYHYSCWSDAYGYRRCGCLPNGRWWW